MTRIETLPIPVGATRESSGSRFADCLHRSTSANLFPSDGTAIAPFDFTSNAADTTSLQQPYSRPSNYFVLDLLRRFPHAPQLLTALAATVCLEVAGISAGSAQTGTFDLQPIVAITNRRRRQRIAVSEKLRASFQAAFTSSLFAPSGAYLTWLEMQADDGPR
jgi:hypothetical protein